MNLFDIMSLKGHAEKLTLTASSDDVLKLLSPFGFTDKGAVDGVMMAARAISNNPEQSIASFVQDGGLVKLMSGQNKKDEDAAIECPHCNQVIFLTLT
jgi:hypothetical protein